MIKFKIVVFLMLTSTVLLFQNCTQADFTGSNEINRPSTNGSEGNLGEVDDGLSEIPGSDELPASKICFTSRVIKQNNGCDQIRGNTIVETSLDKGGNHRIKVSLPLDFVDNTFGLNTIGWEGNRKGHTFDDLEGSDLLEVQLTSEDGEKTAEIRLDYISEDRRNGGFTVGVLKAPKQFKDQVLSVSSSMFENVLAGFNNTESSPGTDGNYSINSDNLGYDYQVWYSMTISSSIFTENGGLGEVSIEGVHASPSKIGRFSCNVELVPCPVAESPVTN